MKIGQGYTITGVTQGHKTDKQTQLILAIGLFATLGVTFFIGWCSALFPQLLSTTYPAVIPYITEGGKCEQTGRVWENGKCFDFEHRADF